MKSTPLPLILFAGGRTLDHRKKYRPVLKAQMRAALQKVAAAKGLSKDVQEVVGRTLGDGN
jgi:hypothetical protein